MATLALTGAGIAAAEPVETGRIGANQPGGPVLNSGRVLHPYGALTTVGNFPAGGAVTPNGRFYWTVSAGRGRNDVRIVNVATHAVIQTLPLPGASGGIVMDPTRQLVYVSGTPNSPISDESRPVGTPGRSGDVIHVYSYDASSGAATFVRVIAIPPPSDAPTPQSFPPTNTQKFSWPEHLAVSPDGGRLLVPLNLADAAAIVDTAPDGAVRYVKTGNYPYGAAILPDGKTGLVSNETPGTVSVIDLVAGTKLKDIDVGGHLSHPEAIALDPVAPRAYVAVANTDQVSVIDTTTMTVSTTLSVGRTEGNGTAPVALTTTPDGRALVVAEEGADELAVISLRRSPENAELPRTDLGHPPDVSAPSTRSGSGDATGTSGTGPSGTRRRAVHRYRHRSRHRRRIHRVKRHSRHHRRAQRTGRARGRAAAAVEAPDYVLLGRIPVGDYPTDVQVSADGTLLWLAAKGLGTGPSIPGPNPYGADGSYAVNYLPDIVTGRTGIGPFPSNDDLKVQGLVANAQVRPGDEEAAPTGTPLRAGGPIKHVFYIVRENRSYDQVLGDDARGDGDPSQVLFGQNVTPNVHALVKRFPLVDHLYANSEASIDGHFWTSAAKVSDYVNKQWHQNYRNNGRPYDFGVYAVTWPGNGFLFDQADRQGISYFNYGEAVAGDVPVSADKDRNAEDTQSISTKLAKSDLGPPDGCYPNDAGTNVDVITGRNAYDSTPPSGAPPLSESRFDCFKTRFTAQDASGTVPAFNYLVLPNDHTQGTTPGAQTPRAAVATNDYGLGQIVDLVSHSSVWSSSAIFVIEDDSQNGPDHIDAHRIPAAVISPYARTGAVVHNRYDFLSVIRSMELILGMKPIGLFDALGTPMYDAFQDTPANSAPFNVISPTYNVNELNTARSANAALSQRLDFRDTDRVSQQTLDRILWQSVHGTRSAPPPPGPNANPGG